MAFSDPYFAILILSFLAYLIGSVPFGLILTKIFVKKDIRDIGSGNIGATIVLRTGNKLIAAATLILDASKAAMASQLHFWMLLILASANDIIIYNPYLGMMLAAIAVLGHCFPIWLKFKGGKGVATALGALLVAAPYAGLAACAAWLITAKITKISSLSALIAVGIAPIVTLIIYGAAPAIICAMITLLVWIRHKDNIKRIIKGEEPKIGAKKKEEKSVEPVSE
jgi:glycerol-3-phosphate acyltransferase PlsY